MSEEELKNLPAAGSVKPFDVLEKQSLGIPRMGILRMDVDNMGDMFPDGLGEKASLARLASLSFAVHLFFEGWVGSLAEKLNQRDKQQERGARLYSIYSGGDDLFFVGSWDAVAELAVEIRADLGRYTNYHPGVHTSAGIVLVGGKYPLSQAAQDAGRAEQAAKSFQWFKEKQLMRKDAITFLGKTLPWERFSDPRNDSMNRNVVRGMMGHLNTLVTKQGANQQLLRLLMQLQIQFDEALLKRRLAGKEFNKLGEPQFPWGPWMWLGDYYLARQARQARGKSLELEAEIQKIKADIKDNFHNIEWFGLAARWAELLSR
jgi:CRISPR-associated protein Csm1